MAKRVFKKLTIRKTYRAWEDWEVGDLVIGKIRGIHKDQKFEKDCYMIDVEEAEFSDKKLAKEMAGKTLVLNHSGMLNKSLDQLSEGDVVQIIYQGKGKMEKGKYKGKEAHTFEVDQVVDEGEEDTSSDEESQEEEKTEGDDW